MAVAVSMANDGRDVHPFFIPKASESPARRITLILELISRLNLNRYRTLCGERL